MATTEELLNDIRNDQVYWLSTLTDVSEDVRDLLDKLGKKGGSGSGSGGGGGPGPAKKDPSVLFGDAIPKIEKFVEGMSKSAASLGVLGIVAAAAGVALVELPMLLKDMARAALPFVNALSPSTVQAYQREMANLMATVGEGLMPTVVEATAALRDIGGVILPTMQEIKPEVALLSKVLRELAVGDARLFAVTLKALAQAGGPFLAELSKWVELLTGAAEILAVLIDTLGIMEDSLGLDVAKEFREVLSHAVVGLGLLAAMTMKAVGAVEMLAKFKSNLEKRQAELRNPGTGLMAAPTDSRVSGAEDIAKTMNAKAFVATSGADASRSDNEALNDLVRMIGTVEKFDWATVIAAGVRKAIKDNGGEKILAAVDVVKKFDDASATTGERVAAAEAGGANWAERQAVRGLSYGVDLYRGLTR